MLLSIEATCRSLTLFILSYTHIHILSLCPLSGASASNQQQLNHAQETGTTAQRGPGPQVEQREKRVRGSSPPNHRLLRSRAGGDSRSSGLRSLNSSPAPSTHPLTLYLRSPLLLNTHTPYTWLMTDRHVASQTVLPAASGLQTRHQRTCPFVRATDTTSSRRRR